MLVCVVTVLKSVNSILAPPADKSLIPTKREKRGIFGFGNHNNHNNHHYDDDHHHHHDGHHHHHDGYAPYFDNWAPPPHPHPPHNPPGFWANLGAHFHTTITKKVAVPYPVPYPVKVNKFTNLHSIRTYLC